MAVQLTKSNINELEPGDMVEFKRGVYSHWGIYKGNEEVIHLSGVDASVMNSNPQNHEHSFSIADKVFNKAEVAVDNIWGVSHGCEMYKKNYLDNKSTPLPQDDIMSRAMSKVGPISYNLIIENCEHFATWCRYGDEKGKSRQADKVIRGVATAAVAVAGAIVGGAALYIAGRPKGKDK